MRNQAKFGLVTLLFVLLNVYVGSYVYLSAQGKYGDEYPGSLMDGPVIGWQPKLLHVDVGFGWNYHLVYFYMPVLLLDRAFWHPSDYRFHHSY